MISAQRRAGCLPVLTQCRAIAPVILSNSRSTIASSDENAVRFFMLFEQLQQKVEDMKAITETMRETSIENAEKFLNALRGALSAIMANLEGGGSNVG